MKRRQFISGATLLALLPACNLWQQTTPEPLVNLSTSIPTAPKPTNTHMPLTVTPTPMPTSTASTITETPTATLTPTPRPTPYPPGPPSKLGLFVTRHDPKVLDLVAQGRPALVKTLEIDGGFVKGLKQSSPDTLIIGRIRLDQMNLDIDPLPLARDFVNQLLPLAHDPDRMASIEAWEAYNEPVADTVDKMKRLADFEAERTRLLAAEGIRSVVGNFAAGHPPLELWPQFQAALAATQQHNGYLGLHEYSAPVMQFRSGDVQLAGEPGQGDEGWLTLRYRKAYRQYLNPMGFGNIPTLITECGVDGLVHPRPGPEQARGWQDFIETWLANGLRDDPPGVYMDQLIWYDENLQQDDYIKGAAIFLVGTNDDQWTSYDILGNGAGRMADLLQQYLQVHPR